MSNRKRRAVIYVRQSKEREGSYSLDDQVKRCREHAARHKYEVVEEVIDPDISGRKYLRRPEIRRVIELARSGEVDIVLIRYWSRGARDDKVWAKILNEIEQAGANIEAADEPTGDTESAAGWLQRQTIINFAVFESKMKSETWRGTHRTRVDMGLYPGGAPPLFYVKSARQGRVPPEPDKRIREYGNEAYQMYIRGYGPESIALWLNEKGVRLHERRDRKTGKRVRAKVNVNAVARWLDTGFAAGYLRVHDPACYERGSRCKTDNETGRRVRYDPETGIAKPCKRTVRVKGIHEAIIDESTWDAYQRERERRRQRRPKDRQPHWFLGGGLTVCGLCGSNMVVNSHTHPRAQAACSLYRHDRTCAGMFILKGSVESAVLRWVDDHIKTFVDRAESLRGTDKERDRLSAELDTARAVEERIHEGQRTAASLVRRGLMSEENYIAAQIEAERDLAETRERITEVEAQLGTLEPDLDELDRMGRLFDEGDLDPREWRVILGKILRRVAIHQDEITIEPRGTGKPYTVSRNSLRKRSVSPGRRNAVSRKLEHDARGRFTGRAVEAA